MDKAERVYRKTGLSNEELLVFRTRHKKSRLIRKVIIIAVAIAFIVLLAFALFNRFGDDSEKIEIKLSVPPVGEGNNWDFSCIWEGPWKCIPGPSGKVVEEKS